VTTCPRPAYLSKSRKTKEPLICGQGLEADVGNDG
jgi:hypothetical protein